MVSTRSEKEYNTPTNYASNDEGLRAPKMSSGNLNKNDILKEIDTGVYLSNLHYLNWSDRIGGRITGMTRYACFWVENGEIIAPIDNMRFDDTIYNNIKLGDIEADNETIHEAAKKANAYEFINKMPNKFQTNIGEKGVKISGGQKQRIAIARAIIKNPDILILDEATSSLDSKSEKKIQDAIDSLSKETTLIVIAHRLSTIENSDKIIVMEQGKIVEQGDHKSLLAKNGAYAKLHNFQFSEQDTVSK